MDNQEHLDTETQDSQPVEQDLELDLETGETGETSTEDVEALKAKNAKLYARAKKAEELLKKVKTQAPQNSTQPPKESQDIGDAGTRLSRLETAEAKRQFGYEHGLSPEETDKVFSITPKPTKETLEDPFIKAGLEAIRKAKRVAEATPSPSKRSATFNGKNFKDLNPEERKKAYESRA